MATIVMASSARATKLDGSVRSRAFAFLEKLQENDAAPGLHVEPIQQSADPRVRTGRVDQAYRAVMFRLDAGGEPHYVIHGIYMHDDAIALAKRLRLSVNPVNGLPSFAEVEPVAATPASAPPVEPATTSEMPALAPPAGEPAAQPPPAQPPADDTLPEPVLVRAPAPPPLRTSGVTLEQLTGRLGVPADVAEAALSADDEELQALVERHEGWLGLMLLDLATGASAEDVVESMGLEPSSSTGDADADVIASLSRPASKAQFTIIEDDEELRRVIEQEDFEAWRVFLHPNQRQWVDKSTNGAFRLSGGAGTGKTVVVVHRARALARRAPSARILVTTYTRNLAASLESSLVALDPSVRRSSRLGDVGVATLGVDRVAYQVLGNAPDGGRAAAAEVLGEGYGDLQGRSPDSRWRDVLASTSTDLPPSIAHESFMAAEYATVVLPHRITDEAGYLRVRRPGRGTALDRARRRQVWALVEAYRTQGRMSGQLDFGETAAVAATQLERTGPVVDHVLVDEGQDLQPAHWQLLRACVAAGQDDLFIAEDSHQRIYGPKLTLSRFGINIVGRSRRLTLNYRTTAQNLRYAMGVLEGGQYEDLEGGGESSLYRSARSGPAPRVVQAGGLGAQLEETATAVRGWLEQGVRARTIAVLVRDGRTRTTVARALGERRVRAHAVDRDVPPSDRVLVMTRQRSKGLEFSRVVLFDGGPAAWMEQAWARLDDAERADAELRDRSTTYVAATRARDELVVIE
ncbi:UvrD-helicase domain-containing protein [Pseudokineococcus basanitobsidens]|uniref:UvrD-helicase domain-containing protein n=1 Tax=Pseudokineococcus basanitobsidens TaxID=1926649 RepID=A0ABU8RF53_9ACTN